MTKYDYEGLKAFEPDEGTFWSSQESGYSITGSPGDWASVQAEAKGRPFIWFVDDELGNREWFRDFHVGHFALATFSAYRFARNALDYRFPCDAVVTDIFFPAAEPKSKGEAEELLSIYPAIKDSRVEQLPKLWEKKRSQWSLDGFKVASDFSRSELTGGKQVPVFLFSRKAIHLLRTPDLPDDPNVLRNTFWLIEKHNPAEEEGAEVAAEIQRARVTAVLEMLRRKP